MVTIGFLLFILKTVNVPIILILKDTQLISKKLTKILNKLVKPIPCAGCLGTKKYHLSTRGRIRSEPCSCQVHPLLTYSAYQYYFNLYTQNCKCTWHLDYYGERVDKKKSS